MVRWVGLDHTRRKTPDARAERLTPSASIYK